MEYLGSPAVYEEKHSRQYFLSNPVNQEVACQQDIILYIHRISYFDRKLRKLNGPQILSSRCFHQWWNLSALLNTFKIVSVLGCYRKSKFSKSYCSNLVRHSILVNVILSWNIEMLADLSIFWLYGPLSQFEKVDLCHIVQKSCGMNLFNQFGLKVSHRSYLECKFNFSYRRWYWRGLTLFHSFSKSLDFIAMISSNKSQG